MSCTGWAHSCHGGGAICLSKWGYTRKSRIEWIVQNSSLKSIRVSEWKEVNISWAFIMDEAVGQADLLPVLYIRANTLLGTYYSQWGSERRSKFSGHRCPGSGNKIYTDIVMISKTMPSFVVLWWYPGFMHLTLSTMWCKEIKCFVPSSETFWTSSAIWGCQQMRWFQIWQCSNLWNSRGFLTQV